MDQNRDEMGTEGQLVKCPICGYSFKTQLVRPDGIPMAQCLGCGAWHASQPVSHTREPMNPDRIDWQRELLESLGSRVNTLFDIGCGSGEFISVANRLGIVADGIELDRELARMAGVRWGDFLSAQLDHYDLATAWDVIEHVQDPRQFVAKARGIASILLLSTPDPNFTTAFLHSFEHRWLLGLRSIGRLMASYFQHGYVARYVQETDRAELSGMIIAGGAVAGVDGLPAPPQRLGGWNLQRRWTWMAG